MTNSRPGPSLQKSGRSPGRVPPFERAGAKKEKDLFAVVKLRFEIPKTVYLYPFSRAHPALLVIVNAAQILPEGRVLAEFDILGSTDSDYADELRGLSGVFSASRLSPVGPRTRYQAVAELPSYLVLANELEVLCRYPRFVQNGEYTVEAAARTSQIRSLVEGLRRLSREVSVLSFGRDPMRTCPPSLTPRQNTLLHQALAAGYFDVPRRISLTEFARELGRSKSSMSRALAVIERTLAESTLATPE